MEKKILRLVEDKMTKIGRVKIYENDFYTVKEYKRQYGVDIDIRPKRKFIPSIYTNFDLEECKVKKFDIGTTAYSETTEDDIRSIIKGYEMALLTVEQLKEMYLDEEE